MGTARGGEKKKKKNGSFGEVLRGMVEMAAP
jgi:hypothetical protein